MQNVREKIQQLGTVRELSDDGMKRLQRATDTYSKLLSNRPALESSFRETSSVSPSVSVDNLQGDLLEDESKGFIWCVFLNVMNIHLF